MQRLILPLLFVAACSAGNDKPDDTDDGTSDTANDTADSGSDSGDTSDTSDTSDTQDTSDTDGLGDTDDTDGEVVATWEGSRLGSVAGSGSLTASDLTVTCTEDGYGLSWRADFGTGSFLRFAFPWATSTFVNLGYRPTVGFLFRVPTGSAGANEDWGSNGVCQTTITAPDGVEGPLSVSAFCDSFTTMVGGKAEDSTFTLTFDADPTTCTGLSQMKSCDPAFQDNLGDCSLIPATYCEDFGGCSVGSCEINHALCSGLTPSSSCETTPGCDWDIQSSSCYASPSQACFALTDASGCGAEAGCLWDTSHCVGTTSCSNLPEGGCLDDDECSPTY